MSVFYFYKTHRNLIKICILLKDIEQGFDGTKTIPTEEAIIVLMNSYNSSELSQQVHEEVASLSKKVTFIYSKRFTSASGLVILDIIENHSQIQ